MLNKDFNIKIPFFIYLKGKLKLYIYILLGYFLNIDIVILFFKKFKKED
jgi:hypothetical protein